MERALLNNILKIYGIGFCHAFQLVIPVFVPMLLGKGLSMAEILQTQAVYALTIALFEVPSGYLADIYGRKVSLVLSAGLMLLSYACLYSAESFYDFLVFEIVMGVAMSLSSGSDMAMLFDSQLALQKLNAKFRLPASVGRLVSLSSLAEALAAVLASLVFLYGSSHAPFETLLAMQLLVGVPPVLLVLTLVEPPRTGSGQGHQDNARHIASTLLYGDRMVLWISLAMVLFGVIALLVFWTYQSFWEIQGVPIEYFGFLWALHCLIRALSAHITPWLEELMGPRQLLIVLGAMPVVALLGMAGLPGLAAVACALLFPLWRGLNAVLLYDALNRRVDGAFRATINSLLNLLIRLVFILFGPLLGFAVDSYGMRPTLLFMAVCALPLLVLVMTMLLRVLHVQGARSAQPIAVAEEIPAGD